MAIDVPKTIVEKYGETDTLELINYYLATAEQYLRPQQSECHGVNFGFAYAQVKDARAVLKALIEKKAPKDPSIIL